MGPGSVVSNHGPLALPAAQPGQLNASGHPTTTTNGQLTGQTTLNGQTAPNGQLAHNNGQSRQNGQNGVNNLPARFDLFINWS